MNAKARRTVGTITMIDDHPGWPYEIRIEDQHPFRGRSAAVRAAGIGTAADLFAALLVWEEQRAMGVNARRSVVMATWRTLARLYRLHLRLAEGDLGEVRVEVDGLILDPDGDWSPDRHDRLPIMKAAG